MLNLQELNGLERHEFTRIFASVFEHSPWIAARTAGKRPFADRDEFFAALCETVMKANSEEKLCLIRAHPDLIGSDVLSPESKTEQACAGLGNLSAEEIARFQQYNAQIPGALRISVCDLRATQQERSNPRGLPASFAKFLREGKGNGAGGNFQDRRSASAARLLNEHAHHSRPGHGARLPGRAE